MVKGQAQFGISGCAFPSLLLLLICSGDAAELLRDLHTDMAYIFESDAKSVAERISREDVLLRADEWATGFYGDAH
jgi:hypothetical protein